MSCLSSVFVCGRSSQPQAQDANGDEGGAKGRHVAFADEEPKNEESPSRPSNEIGEAGSDPSSDMAEFQDAMEEHETEGGISAARSARTLGTNLNESVYFDTRQSQSDPLQFYPPATIPNRRPRGSVVMEDPNSLLDSRIKKAVSKRARRSSLATSVAVVRKQLKVPRVKTAAPGYPGELTQEELATCLKFRKELKEEEDSAYKEMVNAFSPVEEEPYALCRFLRSRKFKVEDVFAMMSEGVDIWKYGKQNDFFPDASKAIGAPVSIFLTQYPFFYYGTAKNGCPVCYFRAGPVTAEGIECLTDMSNITNYVWHITMHMFKGIVAKAQETTPDVVRCESVNVFDLQGLSSSQVNSRTLEVLKRAADISICFPEILNTMVLINSPGFFSVTWRIIKAFLDPRTASKVSVFSNDKKAKEWLHEHIDKKNLLSDYGGKAPSFDTIMQQQGKTGEEVACRRHSKVMSIRPRKTAEFEFELSGKEQASLRVYTRAAAGGSFSLFKGTQEIKTANIVPEGGDNAEPTPYSGELSSDVSGPGKFRVLAKSNATKGTEHFLLIGDVTNKT